MRTRASYIRWPTTDLSRLCAQAAGDPGEEQIVCGPIVRLRLANVCSRQYSNAPKYRLVVRFTNREVIVQIVYARLQGDFVLTAARSKELPRYGINHGLTNWTAGAFR